MDEDMIRPAEPEQSGAIEGELTQPYRVFDSKEAWQEEIDRIFAARFRSERLEKKKEEASKAERLNAHVDELKGSIAEFCKNHPGFDFSEALKNADFHKRLTAPCSIDDAYRLSFAASEKEEKPYRPRENGLMTPPASVGRPDVTAMSKKEFSHLLDEVKQGRVIS